MNFTQFFPVNAKIESGNPQSLITPIIVYIAAAIVASLVLGTLLGAIPLVGWIFRLVSGVVGLYCSVGIILSLLVCFNVINK